MIGRGRPGPAAPTSLTRTLRRARDRGALSAEKIKLRRRPGLATARNRVLQPGRPGNIPASSEVKPVARYAGIDVVARFPGGVGGGETGTGQRHPIAVRAAHPPVTVGCSPFLMNAIAVPMEIFDEGMITAQPSATSAGAESREFPPMVTGRHPSPGGVRGLIAL